MYHSFIDENGNEYGSFEVFKPEPFETNTITLTTQPMIDLFGETLPAKYKSGYYWQSCFPGCLPDSDPVGPFDSEAEAINDANEV